MGNTEGRPPQRPTASRPTSNLQALGQHHGTDKHDGHHHFAGASYLDIYDRYLGALRDQPLNLLEIGVRDGRSHRMWRDYFPNATIYGIDIDPRCERHQSDRIRIFIGDQSSPDTVAAVIEEAGSLDCVLDDGSHVNQLTLRSFDLLFPHLTAGGLYIMEDLACSYLGAALKRDIEVGRWPGMQFNTGVNLHNDRADMNKFFESVIQDIDVNVAAPRTGVEWIHFYSRIAVMKKLGSWQPQDVTDERTPSGHPGGGLWERLTSIWRSRRMSHSGQATSAERQ